jgi:hypothetical protein
MPADVFETYVAYCDECDWESDASEFRRDAERAAERHDEEEHPDGADLDPDSRTPREIYQDELDAIVDAARANVP